MNDTDQPKLSFVLATRNRREVLAQTLEQVEQCGLSRREFEIIVVDNASEDGTGEAVQSRCDVLLRLAVNAGSCAKADGVEQARGRYIVFLDDDSYPHPGSVRRMIDRFETDAALGAAGFVVHLPDGRIEGAALPDVFVGCGVGFRAEALHQAGGLDRSFFMQAEEYDLAFRLAGAGWRVRMFDDLHVEHLKTPQARRSARTTFYDVRNNLRVAARYLPAACACAYQTDWLQRYRWLAQMHGHRRSFACGAWSGLCRGVIERPAYHAKRLAPNVFERFFQWTYVEARTAELARAGIARVVFADLGKNIYAYHRAARRAGLTVLAVADDRFGRPGRFYRGTPVITVEEALALDPDAVVVANSSSVHGTATYERLSQQWDRPIHRWFSPTAGRAKSAESHPAATTGEASDQVAVPAGGCRKLDEHS